MSKTKKSWKFHGSRLQRPIWNLESRFRLWVATTTLAQSSCQFQKDIKRRSSSTVAQIRAAVSKGSLKDGNLDPAVTHVPKEMWPPSSPDLNPLDYWAQGYFKAWSNRRADTKKISLIATIKENFAILYRDMMTRACERFRGRVWAVIEAGVSHISIQPLGF